MAESFKVGEIVIIQNMVGGYSIWNGVEVEIIADLGVVECFCAIARRMIKKHLYDCRFPDGVTALYSPHELRRRPPKSNDTEWAQSKVRDLLKVKPEVVPC